MKTELKQKITDVFKDIYNAVLLFDENDIDKIPFEGSWTAGKVAEHLIKAMSGFPELVQGKTEETKREPDEKTKAITDLFLNFDIQMKSPDFLIPTKENHSKKAILSSFQKIEKEMMTIAETNDLTLTPIRMEIPGFGAFTIYEWIFFALTHAQRHTRQLENIYKKLKSNQDA